MVNVHFESESRTWGMAARIVTERVRAMPEFTEALELIVAGAVAVCGSAPSVARMRELGGFSKVIEQQRLSLPQRCFAKIGTPLLPTSIAIELCAADLDLVNKVKTRLARAA